MKVSPIAQGTGAPAGVNVGPERMPQDRIAAAKAIAEGREPPIRVTQSDTPIDQQVEKVRNSIRRIKMKTQVSTDRPIEEVPMAAAPAPVAETTQEAPQNATTDTNEPGSQEDEATKPLSPQLAALARQRRALQAKERELADRESKLKDAQPNLSEYISKKDLIANPLLAFEAGLTYDQMTQAILNGPSSQSTAEIQSIKEEIKALKEGVDKSFATREQEAEEAALHQMADEAEAIANSGDDFELIKSKKAYDQVLSKIYNTYKQTGKLLNVVDVMKEVEIKLLGDIKKDLELKKIQGLIQPQAPAPQQRSQLTGMRTLTNRDGASVPMSRRDRAIAKFYGR